MIPHVVVSKKHDPLMRLIGRLWPGFMLYSWTTYRIPFMRARVCHPIGVNPENKLITYQHELMHVKQLHPWYGPFLVCALYFLLPLPVFFSGRWFIERHAFLWDIRMKLRTVDDAIDALHGKYFRPWPKSWMREWFEKKLVD